jgi:quercetin dioxygenase-like cupin family protein
MSLPEFHPKGWGYESWIVNNEKYCGKLLFFKKGKRCSLHYHKLKDETFYVHKGRLEILYGPFDKDAEEGQWSILDVQVLEAGDTFHVPVGMLHQMVGLEDTEMFEFSTQHFEEDSYRINKGD